MGESYAVSAIKSFLLLSHEARVAKTYHNSELETFAWDLSGQASSIMIKVLNSAGQELKDVRGYCLLEICEI